MAITKVERNPTRRRVSGLFIGVILCAFALELFSPYFAGGIIRLSDAPLHVYRAVQIDRLVHEGYLLSRWAPDLYLGLGYPVFNFYAPLFYYVVEAVHLLGFNFEIAVKVVLCLSWIAMCVFTYGLARQWLSRAGAVVAASAYASTPYFLRVVYDSGTLPQFLALSLVPGVLWAVHSVLKQGPRWKLAWIGLVGGYAVVILTHNITAMLSAPLILVYALLVGLRSGGNWKGQAAWIGIAICCACMVSAFYWFPAIYETKFVQLDRLRLGNRSYQHFFVAARELLSPIPPIEQNAINPIIPWTVGPVHAILTFFGVLAAIKRRVSRRVVGFFLAAGLYALLMFPSSAVIWQHIGILQYAQFPSRLFGPVGLLIAVLCGCSVELLRADKRGFIGLLACFFLMVSVQPLLFLPKERVDLTQVNICAVAEWEVQTGGIGATADNEYLPVWASELATARPLLTQCRTGTPVESLDRQSLPPGAVAEQLEDGALRHEFRFTSPTLFSARFNILHYLGWRAYLDGKEAEISPSEPEGLIQVQVPSGMHRLRLSFESTPVRNAAAAVSIIGVGAVLLVALLLMRARVTVSHPSEDTERVNWALFGAAIFVAVLGIKMALGNSQPAWLRPSTPADAIPGCQYLHMQFGDELELLGYQAAGLGQAGPGQRVALTLFWRALPARNDYSVSVQLFDANWEKRAQHDNGQPGGADGAPTRSWPPTKFAYDRHLIEVPANIEPGVYYVGVSVYHPGLPNLRASTGRPWALLPRPVEIGMNQSADQPVNVTFSDSIVLKSYRLVHGQQPERLQLRLAFVARRRTEQDYTIFVHVYDQHGNLLQVADGPPLSEFYTTSYWQPGVEVVEWRPIPLPGDMEADVSSLGVGLYDPHTGARLPGVIDGRALENGELRIPFQQ